jgi:hypothetical protein
LANRIIRKRASPSHLLLLTAVGPIIQICSALGAVIGVAAAGFVLHVLEDLCERIEGRYTRHVLASASTVASRALPCVR